MDEATTVRVVEAETDEVVVPRGGRMIPQVEVTPRRVADVRRQLITLRERANDLYLEMGQLLREVQQHRYWHQWGLESFEEYIESELQMKRRKAYYLISVVDAYERLALSPAEREGITLSNAVEIARRTRDPRTGQARELTPEQREELLEQGRTMTTRDLRQLNRHENGLPPAEFVARNFAVQQDQALVVDQALDAVRRAAGDTDEQLSKGRLLELMAAEYLAGANGLHVVHSAERPTVPTLENSIARAREAFHDLNALDPEGEVILKLAIEVIGEIPCPNCGVPIRLPEDDAPDAASAVPLEVEAPVVVTGSLFGAAA